MKQMTCVKCSEETVYFTENFHLPFGCRKCGHQFDNGVTPKNEHGVPFFNTDGTRNKLSIIVPEGSIIPTSIPVVRVVSKSPVKGGLKFPSGDFSQKELAAFNGFDNYKVVWSDLQKFLASGVLVKSVKREKAEGQRGKSAQLFRVG